jgi:formylglycine-generating enzyme required for sulfatase activity
MSADCGWCPAMVTLRAGRFLMGSPSDEAGRLAVEGPQHLVTIEKPFAIGKFAVTVHQFGAFVAETTYPVGTTCRQWSGKTAATTPGGRKLCRPTASSPILGVFTRCTQRLGVGRGPLAPRLRRRHHWPGGPDNPQASPAWRFLDERPARPQIGAPPCSRGRLPQERRRVSRCENA